MKRLPERSVRGLKNPEGRSCRARNYGFRFLEKLNKNSTFGAENSVP